MKTPARFLRALESVRTSLVTAPHGADLTSFSDVFDEFLAVAQSPGFMDLGSEKENEEIHELIQVAVSRYRGGARVERLRLVEIEDARFLHGAFVVSSVQGAIIYFTEDRQGLVVIMGSPTWVMRVSTLNVDPTVRAVKAPGPNTVN
ncbi:MAG: hypothetical protein HY791_17610 [Deltaproteobacteria bacterium]|nr:hypothetical protein [Deltaproteobacteria bacterium]